MQLPRVVIAAVFFVIGALIAIPAILRTTSGESNASSAPTTATSTATTTATSTATATATATTTSKPTTPPPTPTPTRTTPAQPLTAEIGSVTCPGRTVRVTIRNKGAQTEDYAIERNDGSASAPGTITAGSTKTVSVTLREDRATRIEVTRANDTVLVRTRTANCRTAPPPEALPETGADDTVLWARAVTGGAAMLTGVIIFWYGGIWPRRRENVFSKK
ncbi:hypothetical protein [Spirillospora sp. NPDC047279]|uniref:hypothetical protein n=1 Tax=Spirillospora sp. NPDC047279 TaxID=3155478 RepID=UPI0033C2C024